MNDQTKDEKKIIIDLNADEVINFKGKLNVSDTVMLMGILAELQVQMKEHLEKVTLASYIELTCKIKSDCELSDADDGGIRIPNESLMKLFQRYTKNERT